MDKATAKARRERLKIVNRTAFLKATQYEGRLGKIKTIIVRFCTLWGIFATTVGFLAVLSVTVEDSQTYTAFVGYFFASGLICLTVTMRTWKKFKRAKRIVLKVMAEEEKAERKV